MKQSKNEVLSPLFAILFHLFQMRSTAARGGCPERTSLKPQLWSQTDTDANSCGHRRRGSGCDYAFYLRRTSHTLLSRPNPPHSLSGNNTWFHCFTRNAASEAEHLKLWKMEEEKKREDP